VAAQSMASRVVLSSIKFGRFLRQVTDVAIFQFDVVK
jgi:hypothetical protein